MFRIACSHVNKDWVEMLLVGLLGSNCDPEIDVD